MDLMFTFTQRLLLKFKNGFGALLGNIIHYLADPQTPCKADLS